MRRRESRGRAAEQPEGVLRTPRRMWGPGRHEREARREKEDRRWSSSREMGFHEPVGLSRAVAF